MADFANHRRELAVLTPGGASAPRMQQQPGTALGSNPIAPWMASANGAGPAAAGTFGHTFYDDSSDNLSQASHSTLGFRPGTGLTGNTMASDVPADICYGDERRRPSVASVTTASSQGSKSSVSRHGIHKKLQTFFGEEWPGRDGSDTSLPSQKAVARSHSFARSQPERDLSSAADKTQRDGSPAPSRPRTPIPSSDVVPFLYQDSQVSPVH